MQECSVRHLLIHFNINIVERSESWRKKNDPHCFSLAWVCLLSLPQHAPYMAAVLLFLNNPHTP